MNIKDLIPIWPVAADLLFERVRSTKYMALATSINLTTWLTWTLSHARSALANRPWDSWRDDETNSPVVLYWALYADCANASESSTSGWAQRPCGQAVGSGFIWEVFISSLQFMFSMAMLQTVNNPWRSKCFWSVPAALYIAYGIYDHGRLVFRYPSWADDLRKLGVEVGLELNPDILVFLVRAGMFVLASAWSALGVLLVRVLFAEDDMGDRQRHSLEWTRSLLHLRCEGAKTPTNFQTLAGALRPVCSLQHLPAVATAALMAQKSCEEPPHSQSGPGLLASLWELKAQGMATLVGVKMVPSASPNEDPGEPADQVGEPTEQRPVAAPGLPGTSATTASSDTGGSSNNRQAEGRGAPLGAGERHRRPASLRKLPALAQVSVGLSMMFVIYLAIQVGEVVLTAKLVFEFTGVGVQEMAKGTIAAGEGALWTTRLMRNGTAETLAEVSWLNETLGDIGQQADNISLGIQSAMSDLQAVQPANAESEQALQRALDALQAIGLQASDLQARQLSQGGPRPAGRTASAALGIGVASAVLASVSNSLLTLDGALAQLEGTLVQMMENIYSLTSWVDWATKAVLEFSKSVEITGMLAMCLSIAAVIGNLAFTTNGWKKQLAQLRSGEIRNSEFWKPNTFLPIKAPMLPGVMASTNLFTFVLLWLFLFLPLEVLWMAFYIGFTIPWSSVGVIASTTGLSLLFKTVVLDKLASRLLTHNGFVTRWASFAWFVVLTMPFYALVGILAAIFRFIFVAVFAFVYMGAVHVTILPPSLAYMFDSAWVNSWSMLVLSHRHNSPINYAFARAFVNEGGQKVGHELKRTRAQRNWKLAVTLARNPTLIQSRVNDDVGEAKEDHGTEESEAGGNALTTPMPQLIRL